MADTLYAIAQTTEKGLPTSAQIIAGQDASGSAAPWSGNQTVSTTTADVSFTVTGLSSSTEYEYYFVWSDGTDTSNILPATDGGATFTTTGEAGVTGDILAAESGSDAAALTGGVQITGDLAVTDTGPDTATISGSVIVTGALAATDTGSDSAAITGGLVVTGDIAAAETGADTAAILGQAPAEITGDLAATEVGEDSAAVTGSLIVSGSLSVAETGADTADIDGAVIPFGAGYLSAQEVGADTAAASGAVLIAGTLDATEAGADAADITGTAPVIISGTLDAFEAGSDTAAAIGSVEISGTLTAIEAGDDTALIRERELSAGDLIAMELETDSAGIAGLINTNYGAMYQATIDVNYRIHGRSVIYKNVAGQVSVVRAIIDTEEDQQPAGEVQVRYPTYLIHIRSAELAEPERGATVAIPGTVYTVDGFDPVSEWEWRIYART